MVFVFALSVMAQGLSVTAFEALPNDLTANLQETTVLDQNGQKCALIRIQTPHKGFTYDVGSLGIQKVDEDKTGEIWLYVPAGVRRIDIRHQHLGNLLAYAFPVNIQAARTYRMDLAAANVKMVVQQTNTNTYFIMSVTPAYAQVSVDGQPQMLGADGTLSLLLAPGEHTYSIRAAGYAPENGTFTLGREKLRKEVKLQSVQATLTLTCPTEGATLYVNDQMRGTGSWTGMLAAGNYFVEARKAGYYGSQYNITLAQREQKTIALPALVARTGMLNVNYTPVDAEVFIDGQRVGTSPDMFKDLLMGEHKVEIKKSGYTAATKTVTIEEGKTATLTGELEKMVLPEIDDAAIVDYIRKVGVLSFYSSGTAISKDGSTSFRVHALDGNRISISVSGRTGNGVSFTNRALTMTLKNGVATATSNALKTSRYISFYASLKVSGNKLYFDASYTTASYSRFSISRTVAMK